VIAIVFKALTDNNKQLRGDVQQVAKTLSGYTGLEAETYAAMLSRHRTTASAMSTPKPSSSNSRWPTPSTHWA
jgi:sulfonate transport system substrate-binding protein